jgi:hypothetical protein
MGGYASKEEMQEVKSYLKTVSHSGLVSKDEVKDLFDGIKNLFGKMENVQKGLDTLYKLETIGGKDTMHKRMIEHNHDILNQIRSICKNIYSCIKICIDGVQDVLQIESAKKHESKKDRRKRSDEELKTICRLSGYAKNLCILLRTHTNKKDTDVKWTFQEVEDIVNDVCIKVLYTWSFLKGIVMDPKRKRLLTHDAYILLNDTDARMRDIWNTLAPSFEYSPAFSNPEWTKRALNMPYKEIFEEISQQIYDNLANPHIKFIIQRGAVVDEKEIMIIQQKVDEMMKRIGRKVTVKWVVEDSKQRGMRSIDNKSHGYIEVDVQ